MSHVDSSELVVGEDTKPVLSLSDASLPFKLTSIIDAIDSTMIANVATLDSMLSARIPDDTAIATEGLTTAIKIDVASATPLNRIELRHLPGFLSASECEHFIALAEGNIASSKLIKSNLFMPSVPFYTVPRNSTYLRLADTWRQGPFITDAILCSMIERAAALVGTTVNYLWDLKLLKYEPGQRFEPHTDNGRGIKRGRASSLYSFFVFLNTLPAGEGGETHFTQLNQKFSPIQGDAITWRNCTEDGETYFDESEHQGCAPIRGVKYGLNFFFNVTPPSY